MSRRLPVIHETTAQDVGPYRLERLDLEFGNGERRRFERMVSRGHGAVVVVPMLDDGTVLLVREYAAGVHRYELGLVKGRLVGMALVRSGAQVLLIGGASATIGWLIGAFIPELF